MMKWLEKINCQFIKGHLTFAARMMLLGDWMAARSVSIFLRSQLYGCSEAVENVSHDSPQQNEPWNLILTFTTFQIIGHTGINTYINNGQGPPRDCVGPPKDY